MNIPKYVSTTKAAQLLGLSVGTVQQMVESGQLTAWKTSGGHRRITTESLDSFLSKREPNSPAPAIMPAVQDNACLSICIVEDDEVLLKSYQKLFERLAINAKVAAFNNGLDALFFIGANPPDLLLLDLEIPFVDGFELLKRLQSLSHFQACHVIVITGLEEAQLIKHEKELTGYALIYKPVEPAYIKGYVQALLTERGLR